jgi:hypothetical protein
MKILDHHGSTLFESEQATTVRECCEAAVRANAVLTHARLSGADLKHADLRAASLEGADLSGADLKYANFYRADLCMANFSGADLGMSRLDRADLCGARFDEARINWQAHDLISALLMKEAGEGIGKRKVAGLVLVSRDWCWDSWSQLGRRQPRHFAWALGVLAPYVHPEDEDDIPRALWNAYLGRRAESAANPAP